ncbi:MAG TPA: hypothetical protein VF176_06330 [Solirubrobacterales bacterium]
MEHSGGNRRHRARSRAVLAAALLAAASTLALGACGGGGSSSSASEPSGTYDVRVVSAKFPTRQRLGQTSLLALALRNTGRRAIPSLTVSFSIAGKEGTASSLPFGIRDPQPGLAQPDRPVWVLSEHYPKLNGSSEPGGAETSGVKTYNLGRLEPGKTTQAVWKLSASRTGRYTVLYRVDVGLSGSAKAETAGGVTPGGSFTATITEQVPNTTVNDRGEVVELGGGGRGNG